MDDDLTRLRELSFVESRIPSLDALEGFVPTGGERDPAVDAAAALTGFSRWQPVEGGHKVQFLYEGGAYETTRFKVVKGAWDHEHCKRCTKRIESMTLCFVTTSGPYILLCETCHDLVRRGGLT
jgi:hypothetical protein